MKPESKKSALHARLFAEPDDRGERSADVTTAYIDGASRGNPGPASYGFLLKGPDGKIILEMGKYFGRATNNVAEYYGLINALDIAASRAITRLRVRSDSELLVRQMEGRYKVKSPELKPLHERAQKLSRQFAWFAIEHIPRAQNAEADRLVNEALDRTGGGIITREPESASAEPARASHASKTPRVGARRVSARYADGALIPAEPLDLPEGAEVEITVHERPSLKRR